VDILIVKLEAAAERVHAAQAQQRRTATEAAQRNLLSATEPLRDLLQRTLQGDKAGLTDVFGGSCERVWRIKRVLAKNPALSQTHAADRRWRDLELAILTVEQVLKELGKFRPAIVSRARFKAAVDAPLGRVPSAAGDAAQEGTQGGDEEDGGEGGDGGEDFDDSEDDEDGAPSGAESRQEDVRRSICKHLQGDQGLIETFFNSAGPLEEVGDAAGAAGASDVAARASGRSGDSSSASRTAPIARHFLVSFGQERKISGVLWYPVRLVDTSEERFFLKRFNDFRLLHKALVDHAPAWLVVPSLPEPWKAMLLSGIRQPLKQGLQDYLERLLLQIESLDSVLELELFLGPEAPDRVFPEVEEVAAEPVRPRLMTLNEFLG